VRPVRGRALLWLCVQALACGALLLAAAGWTIQAGRHRLALVVAADVSESIFETEAQTGRVNDFLRALDPDSTDAAVVVFGANPGLERPFAPLSALLGEAGRLAAPRSAPALDLARPQAVVKTGGTNLAAALTFARSLFRDDGATHAILLLSDFRETHGRAATVAAALAGERIRLLATPALLSASRDVQLAEFRVPESAPVSRAVPLEITVASQSAAKVTVAVRRRSAGAQPYFVEARTLELTPPAGAGPNAEARATVRMLDHPPTANVYVYTATVDGADGPLPGDVRVNNALSAAARVTGPARWAVLARGGSTLDKLAANAPRDLGVAADVFHVPDLPTDAARYDAFAGVLVDGLSSAELPPNSPALRALEAATNAGKALVALGGEQAFGAGGHPAGGIWERILPIEMTPDDDRVRSILFLVDVSSSMNDTLVQNGVSIRKKDFAAQQLQAVRALRPQDRLGLITFSGSAQVAAPLSAEPGRSAFLEAVRGLKIESNTDLYAPLARAREVLAADDAREQLVLLLSDGVQTTSRPRAEILEEARKLCPPNADGTRRTTLLTFGIGVGAQDFNATGEALLKDLAAAGGGTYAPDFLTLGERLARTFEQGSREFFVRREPFSLSATPLATAQFGALQIPELNFRNRVKAKSSEVLFTGASRTPGADARRDPLLLETGAQSSALGRRAVLALSFDGPDGERLLQSGSGGRTLLPQLLAWAEARESASAKGYTLTAEPRDGDRLALSLRAFDPASGEPNNALHPLASLTALDTGDSAAKNDPATNVQLKLSAPGLYEALVSAPPASVCRFSVSDAGNPLGERFVSTPCAAEFQRFGVDRAAMAALTARAGPDARVIETPSDLAHWTDEQHRAASALNLRIPLLGLALVLFVLLFTLRSESAS
jgi:Mg-chelatase subunit ChlD